MKTEIYRTYITVQEYDTDGFWNIFEKSEASKGKKQTIESIDKLYLDCLDYINKRVEE